METIPVPAAIHAKLRERVFDGVTAEVCLQTSIVKTEVCVQTSLCAAKDRGFECLLVADVTEAAFPPSRRRLSS